MIGNKAVGELYGQIIENPEFVRVALSEDGKILSATKADGTEDFAIGVETQTLSVADNEVKEISNIEFIAVYLDRKGKIIFGLQKNGNLFFGAGVPLQISSYIKDEIAKLSLDEYPNIVSFLNGLENGDKNLTDLLDEKVDKETNKSLIDENVADSIHYTSNPEYIKAEVDSEGYILGGRKSDGSSCELLRFSAPEISVDSNKINTIEDKENRIEIKTDRNNKIISYRDKDGILNERVGVKTDILSLSQKGNEALRDELDNLTTLKKWYQPKFGVINIKKETFYLTSDPGYSDEDGIVPIQIYEENSTTSHNLTILSYYYVLDSNLIGYGNDGNTYSGDLVTRIGNKYYVTADTNIEVTFNSNSVSASSKQLTLYVKGQIQKVDGINYVKNTLTEVVDPETGDVSYEVNANSVAVTQITDIPCYKAWTVDKSYEHLCLADIDFGTYYNKIDVPVGIKYQGNSTMLYSKRGFRITFYKNTDYKKKDKIKFGEMLRLSGYNMKSYYPDLTRIKDPVLSYVFIEMWETRGQDAFPWNKDNTSFTGATGMIKAFPIETTFGEEFFGLQMFSLKKDERNYMLDGDDDSSGIFVSGEDFTDFANDSAEHWADEMGVDNRELAYPNMGDDSVSVETAAAMNEFFKYLKGFVDGTIEIDGQIVDFELSMLEERIDVINWVDYWIGCQVFQLWDNLSHNSILYSGRDKKKFYIYFYDLDTSLNGGSRMDVLDIAAIQEPTMQTAFWEKFIETYRDIIINRYAFLRKTVLADMNIRNIYNSIVVTIPSNVIQNEIVRWGNGNPRDFVTIYEKIQTRLKWLDDTQFNL